MAGGKIVRKIGGKSVKTADYICFEATNGNLTFNAAKKVNMVGKNGGVIFTNDYKPPLPLRVTKVEGPFNEKGEKVSILEKGKSYKYKAVQFNRELRAKIELRGLKWAMQFNEEELIFTSKPNGKQEITLDVSETESLEKFTLYAYFKEPQKEGKAEIGLKIGGISTRFYDEQGQQVYEIPQKLHKAFNEEYGLKIAYDKENEMLYYEGDCAPAYEKTSPTAIEHWKRELNPATTSKGKLVFGYDFGIEISSTPPNISRKEFDNDGYPLEIKAKEAVVLGVVPGFQKSNGKREIGNIACIDLGDFDDDLKVRGYEYRISYPNRYEAYNLPLPQLTCRYNGLVRNLEHEFIGHVLLKLTDKNYTKDSIEEKTLGPNPVEAQLGNVIRRELEMPDRKSYGGGGYKMNSNDDTAMQIEFGYLNGSMDNPDILKTQFFDPPPKYPPTEGTAILNEKVHQQITKINYILKLKYNVVQKEYNFI